MKKTLVVSSVVIAMAGSVALAQDFQQYVSGKGSVVRLENKFTGSISDRVDSLTAGTYEFGRKKSDTVGGFRLAYGLVFPVGDSALRTEIEYGYNGKSKLDGTMSYTVDSENYHESYKSHIKSQFVMANVYYDFNTGTEWTPYVGGGLGWAKVKATNSIDIDSISKSKNNFAWNLTAGVSYNFNANLALDASYRYADYGKSEPSYTEPDFGVFTKSKVKSNEFNLGFRYTF